MQWRKSMAPGARRILWQEIDGYPALNVLDWTRWQDRQDLEEGQRRRARCRCAGSDFTLNA